MASTYRDHVIVCGLGKVGYRVILELRKFGREVVGVERDADGRFVEKVQALGIPVIIADARREETLVKAGAEPVGSTPQQFADFIRTETVKWGSAVKQAGITPE